MYMRIWPKLNDPVLLVQLIFLQNLEPRFSPFLKQSVVVEKTGNILLSVDVDNTYNRLKHDREMEIGEPTSKVLKKLKQ